MIAAITSSSLDHVFPAGDAAVLTVRVTVAMPVAFLPARPGHARLELSWKLAADDGVNCSALRRAAPASAGIRHREAGCDK